MENYDKRIGELERDIDKYGHHIESIQISEIK